MSDRIKSDTKAITSNLCDRCGVRSGESWHLCPFQEEINNDDSECNCCEECTQNCADDI